VSYDGLGGGVVSASSHSPSGNGDASGASTSTGCRCLLMAAYTGFSHDSIAWIESSDLPTCVVRDCMIISYYTNTRCETRTQGQPGDVSGGEERFREVRMTMSGTSARALQNFVRWGLCVLELRSCSQLQTIALSLPRENIPGKNITCTHPRYHFKSGYMDLQ